LAQVTRKKPPNPYLQLHLRHGIRVGIVWGCGVVALYLLLALFSYNPSDPGWLQTAPSGRYSNLGGVIGAYFTDFSFHFFGYLGYLLPVLVLYAGWLIHSAATRPPVSNDTFHPANLAFSVIGLVLIFAAGSGLATLQLFTPWWCAAPVYHGIKSCGAGGVIGEIVGVQLALILGYATTTVFLLGLLFSGITLFSGVSWPGVAEWLGRYACWVFDAGYQVFHYASSWALADRATHIVPEDAESAPRNSPETRIEPSLGDLSGELNFSQPSPAEDSPEAPASAPQAPSDLSPSNSSEDKKIPGDNSLWAAELREPQPPPPAATPVLPSLTLLDTKAPVRPPSSGRLEHLKRLLEAFFTGRNVDVRIGDAQPGPVITRFELFPGPEVKLLKIKSLVADIAQTLSVSNVRVVELMPGASKRPTIALEVPNDQRVFVSFADVLRSNEYQQTKQLLPLALGKDIGGKPVVIDLQRMPHLLIAGNADSGKSIALHSMVVSLLYKLPPAQTRLIVLDFKPPEFAVYQGIPHLLAPVVTTGKEATNAIAWCVAEMDQRYRLMASLGVHTIAGFNSKISDTSLAQRLPYIVLLVNEFAELLTPENKRLEELIILLAKKARAVGIHLILATQRLTIEVMTPIKQHIQTRIAFRLSSKADSYIILDQHGADQLLGHGDMLYLASGGVSTPLRIHGAYISTQEVQRVVEFWKLRATTNYIDDILQHH